ncbi:MAG: hypothetical protein ACRD15_22420, partial [Vicinamibacterales bacterium]
LGIPGLLMWVTFIASTFTRRCIRRTDMFYFGRRLAYVACACGFATGLIGLGLFTSVPMTALLLLMTGWIVVPEVDFAPAAAPVVPSALGSPGIRAASAGIRVASAGIRVASAFRRKDVAVLEK